MGNTTPTRYTSPHGNGTFVRIKRTLTRAQKDQYRANVRAGLAWNTKMDATLGRFGIIIGSDTSETESCVRFIHADVERQTWFYRDGWFDVVPETEVPTALVVPLMQAYMQQARKEADEAAAEAAAPRPSSRASRRRVARIPRAASMAGRRARARKA